MRRPSLLVAVRASCACFCSSQSQGEQQPSKPTDLPAGVERAADGTYRIRVPDPVPDVKTLAPDSTARISEQEARSVLLNPDSAFPLDVNVVQQFRRDGYVVLRDFYRPEVLSELSEAARGAAERRGLDMPVPGSDQVQRAPPQTSSRLSHYRTDDGKVVSLDKGVKLSKRDVRVLKEKKIYLKNNRDVERAYEAIQADRKSRYNDMGIDAPPKKWEDMSQDELKEEGERQLTAMQRSGEVQKRIDKAVNADLVTAYFQNVQNMWLRLAWTDEKLQSIVRGPAGSALSRVAAELSGNVGLRLYNDTLTHKHTLSNAMSHHAIGASFNVDDVAQAVTATVVLNPADPQQEHSYNRDVGGISIIPGSHAEVMRLTNGGRNLNGLQVATSWNVGEWLRSQETLVCRPAVDLELNPNDAVFIHPLSVYGFYANLDPKVSHWTWMASMVPLHARYHHSAKGWMARDSHGPLHKMQLGDRLEGSDFPVMCSVVSDMDGDGVEDDGK